MAMINVGILRHVLDVGMRRNGIAIMLAGGGVRLSTSLHIPVLRLIIERLPGSVIMQLTGTVRPGKRAAPDPEPVPRGFVHMGSDSIMVEVSVPSRSAVLHA